MITFDTVLLFIAASTVLAITPGPDNIFVLTQSALNGSRAGLWVTLGLCTGLLAHTSAVALGVAVIFQSSTIAFNGLKVAGGMYLIYLAWQALRAEPSALNDSHDQGINPLQLYGRGVIMNMTNPKVAIFFLAFFPQFADPLLGAITLQILLFGGLFIVVTLLVFGTIALCSGAIGDRLKHSVKVQVVLNRVAAIVFVGLALRLLTSER